MVINGFYFDGESSLKQEASLFITGNEVTLQIGDTQKVYLKDKALVSDRIANLKQVIRFPDGSLFETDEYKKVKDTFGKNFFSHFIYEFEKNWKLAIVAGSLIIICAIAFYKFGLPVIAHHMAQKAPQKALDLLQESTINYISLQGMAEPSQLDEETQNIAHEAFKKAIRQFPENTYQLDIVDSKVMGANAFALPAGQIYITDKLVELLKDHPDEIQAVFHHEVAHVIYRHSMESAIERIGLFVFLTLAIGASDYSNLSIALMSSSYSRNAETQADDYAAQELLKQGLSPSLLGSALKKMHEDSKLSKLEKYFSLVSSHPDTTQRIERLKTYSIDKKEPSE